MFGTATRPGATRALLLGSGELGKEVAIELQRFGIEVIAADRYADAPAMQVAHKAHVLDMLDGAALRALVNEVKPDLIIPELEAIATDTLAALEQEGVKVVPNARATQLTMNREGIRRLAAETLGLPTSPYHFAQSKEEFVAAVDTIGLPCVVKPVMSSSGKGQSVLRDLAKLDESWTHAQEGGRAGRGKVIVEGFVPFEYEITLLTVRAVDGIHFCQPIGHRQEDGDYRESWQPQAMSEQALARSKEVAAKVVEALGGYGLFGVELFIKGDEVWFSEVSPRPHDTGMVTLISQDLSEFALHVRAILGLPVGTITQYGPSASAVVLREGHSQDIRYQGIGEALALVPGAQLRLFGKPEIAGRRRLGVALARAEDCPTAVEQAKAVAARVDVLF
ncbi:formate-dependent phosphoribosylglycinamide formyltransferase [Aeromonas hydrophila]|uniref:Formate-dependent phosphoribosylglycinamide formyltransferase n=1 Tax=Aeromonas hydrophila subsp. hydrophila (strain ATCC 7966 / DSM 30187 / BCRC 13018 / CCUG 14551 / JCM 1027 / KCTC 2358 / NCIMB 9240 / NCTC 8049) TaxID=380703 RepID=PURT_AERHH|nr:formate-dependent phosphoribosylglycinamide formyltransferase [Aeromonas hydrophila]A0KK42.1 RecName: Full=Formate-dependent phosphoribosylglycinamide formyltransferase; AltName: Full=5'-phosphoribosylglycinamide transformylase 2; AltName: Full=Formate-dependent GAR transformylase; AltName: Full=GAR transformylase 2; Short=GART 2; AltName: Full=Non-folate glycinamide ribonucleotide transformylase; AltName: Full=Phosphoribosylglycinamide formyltransferase 2 [Aeromonas hydrophila subsp. hydrophil